MAKVSPDSAAGPSPSSGNRLGSETSPYLLQHRDNPVAWRAWGETAFAEARDADKPVLLSVGYAACHWCHVMAHECFEDPAIAELMNRLFITIKVDREERPDVDNIYQAALALLGQHGGWPLTMFLTPEGEPFWGGTYFPPEPRYGRPGFPQVLQAVAEIYANDKGRVQKNTAALKEALGKLSENQRGEAIPLEALDEVASRLVQEIDPLEGGFGSAPKFPQPGLLKLFWRAWKRGGTDTLRHATELTMTKMCQGGIYDHLGGGFARYAVDARWLVPHFEKMLYDNAQLIEVLTWLWQDTRKPLYEQRLRETVDWVLREMIAYHDPDGAQLVGAFAATLDADSEGEEGKFYVWTEAEIDALLGNDAPLFKIHYDVRPEGNWEGKTILNRSTSTRQNGPRTDDEAEARLAKCREILLAARAKRIRPGWDDKVLADWNGLMIRALAEAALAFSEPAWLAAAEKAFLFVRDEMQRDGRLCHAWRHGQLKHPATLDDYADMAAAALSLHEATGRQNYLAQAEIWGEVLDRHYWDTSGGGYFLTADDTPDLIVRTKTAYDAAVPAGNGTMLDVLVRLHFLTGKVAYRERAEELMRAFSGELTRNFFPLATLLNSAELPIAAQQVVIVGARGTPETDALLRAVTERCLPNRILLVIAPGESLPAGHPAAGKGQVSGKATAYLCHGQTCSLPMTEPAKLGAAFDAAGKVWSEQP